MGRNAYSIKASTTMRTTTFEPLPPLSTATLGYIAQHATTDVAQLALRGCKTPEVDLPIALLHIEALQRLRTKVPTWATTEELRFPLRLALEQCSGEAVARHKATVVSEWLRGALSSPAPCRMADLTGGLGVDFWALATALCPTEAHYIEQHPLLCAAALHNMPCLGLTQAQIHHTTAEAWLDTLAEDSLYLIYLDPARRDTHGRKTVLLEDCTPNLIALLPRLLQKAPMVVAKLSPMLDLHSLGHHLSGLQEIHVYSHQGECKEVVLFIGRSPVAEPRTYCHAMDYDAHLSFLPSVERIATFPLATTLSTYLYEPDVAVMKAQGFASVMHGTDLEKLHPHSHLYTSPTYHPTFVGRRFRIVATTLVDRKVVHATYKTLMREGQQASKGKAKAKANLTTRHFPTTVAELRKKLQLAEGGHFYLFATTLHDGRHVLVWCEKH